MNNIAEQHYEQYCRGEGYNKWILHIAEQTYEQDCREYENERAHNLFKNTWAHDRHATVTINHTPYSCITHCDVYFLVHSLTCSSLSQQPTHQILFSSYLNLPVFILVLY